MLRGDRRATLVALLVGPWLAAAVIIGHFLPYWGEFSDPHTDAGLDAVSHVLALATAGRGCGGRRGSRDLDVHEVRRARVCRRRPRSRWTPLWRRLGLDARHQGSRFRVATA
jgi:hypothetical protein